MSNSPSFHIAAAVGDIARVVLFPGDPLRAKTLAERYLDEPKQFNDIRNMFGYTGLYRGRRISVMGSGMGIPSATLYAHELYTLYGAESILRIGTAGGVADDLALRSLVVPMTASTDSAFSVQYGFPGTLAPAADWDLLRSAVESADAAEIPVRVGSVFSTDVFYNYDPTINTRCRDLGMLAVDMETAGLYWEAAACHKRALSILTVSNNILTGEETPAAERQEAFTDMMRVALETAWRFAGEDEA